MATSSTVSLASLPEDVAGKSLAEALQSVGAHGRNLRRAVDSPTTSIHTALAHGSAMLQELRTGSLTPKNYYQLYMAVFDELRVLQEALVERFGGEPVVGVGAGADGGGGNGSGNDEKDDKRNDDDDQLYRRASTQPPTVTAAVAVDVDESPLVSLSIDESEEGKQVAATAASIAAQDASTTVSKPPPPAKASVSKASVVTRKQTPQHALAQLYDYVQFTNTSALPRLYLMITVGSAYMAVTNAPRRSLLLDLLDMCKAVQHPTRGLFLRYYMQQMTRDQMPLEEKGGRRGSLSDTLYFLLQNFTEMNKLWVRMQHQGPVRERPKREEERRDLRILVGTNLVRLSQLEGLDLRKYRGEVLPRILEQVVSCKDPIAQEYLMEAIIQVYQDEFHLRTLDQLLQATGQLVPQVNIKQIITAFIDRLAAFALRERENQDDENAETKGSSDAKRSSSPTDAAATATGIPNDIKLFEIFWEQVSGIIKSRAELTLEDVVQLLVSLENLGLSCYPARLDYVEKIYAFAREQFAAVKPELMDNRSLSKPILKLLTGPLEIYPDITTVLNNGPLLDSICSLLAVLPFSIRHAAALVFLRDMLKRGTRLTNPDHVQRVLGDLLAPLVRDQKDGGAKAGKSQSLSSSDKIDAEEWRTEQNEMAKLVHLLYDDAVDVDQCFLVLNVVRKQLGEGGVDRVRHTLPSLMTSCLKLARRYRRMQSKRSDSDGGSSDAEQWEKKLLALFKFMHQTVLVVYKAEHHELALRLFLLPLQDPSVLVGFEMIAYEYIVQAFTIYEEAISESKSQIAALQLMMGTLLAASNTGVFTVENYDTLITKVALYASKLLKKADQCRMIYHCSHLFWGRDASEADLARMLAVEHRDNPDATAIDAQRRWMYRDGKRVLECLQKSLKIADASMDTLLSLRLFVELLNVYIVFFKRGNPSITTKYINGLVELVHSNLQTIHADPSSIAVGAGGGAVSSSDTDLFVGSGADDGVNSGRPRSDSAASPEVALRRIQKFFLDTLQHMAEVKRRVVSADVPPGGGSAGAMEERERWNAIVLEDVLGSVSALRS